MDTASSKIPFPVLFENDDVIAINKPEKVLSIPERGNKGNDLLSILTQSMGMRPYVVHRLDKGVSGVILFAKNAAAHQFLNDQFAEREIQKTYFALLLGRMSEEGGTIEKPIRKFGSGRMGVDLVNGKAATTRFHVVERFSSHTLVEVHPVTGRRHQIRVHFFSINYAIAGDREYGDQRQQKLYPRLMLHAREIEFQLPSGEKIKVEAAFPESFRTVLNGARSGLQSTTPPGNSV